jgi:hypothetical protein
MSEKKVKFEFEKQNKNSVGKKRFLKMECHPS